MSTETEGDVEAKPAVRLEPGNVQALPDPTQPIAAEPEQIDFYEKVSGSFEKVAVNPEHLHYYVVEYLWKHDITDTDKFSILNDRNTYRISDWRYREAEPTIKQLFAKKLSQERLNQIDAILMHHEYSSEPMVKWLLEQLPRRIDVYTQKESHVTVHNESTDIGLKHTAGRNVLSFLEPAPFGAYISSNDHVKFRYDALIKITVSGVCVRFSGDTESAGQGTLTVVCNRGASQAERQGAPQRLVVAPTPVLGNAGVAPLSAMNNSGVIGWLAIGEEASTDPRGTPAETCFDKTIITSVRANNTLRFYTQKTNKYDLKFYIFICIEQIDG